MTKTRVIRDGQVAVVYAPGYGAGWSSWNNHTDDGLHYFLMFDPTLVDMVLHNRHDQIPAYVASVYPKAYTSAAEDLCIVWIPQGWSFLIAEYDGAESIQLKDATRWVVA